MLILEIADDAQRLKMGSEDKIRVAGKACEEVSPVKALHISLRQLRPFLQLSQTRAEVNVLLTQISTVIEHFAPTLSVHSTTYPHVAPSSLLPVTGEFSGRRKRMPASGLNLISARDSYPTASPAKKRRIDDDGGSIRGGITGKPPKPKDKLLGHAAKAKPRLPYVFSLFFNNNWGLTGYISTGAIPILLLHTIWQADTGLGDLCQEMAATTVADHH